MTRFWLFLSSLSPGAFVVGIRLFDVGLFQGLAGIGLGIALIPIGMLTVHSRKSVSSIPKELRVLRDETYQVPTYLVTFVLPFLFVDFESLPITAAYAFFIVFVALMLSKSDISIISPALLILNYRMYDAVSVAGESITVISKRAPRVCGYENLRLLSGRVYLLESKESDKNE